MVDAATLTDYTTARRELVRLAQNDLTAFWDALLGSTSEADFATELLKFFPDLLTSYGESAAVLGADFYNEMRRAARQGVTGKQFQAVIAMPAPDEQSIRAAKWALGSLYGEEPNAPLTLSKLNGIVQRLVTQPFRDSIWYSAAADPVRTGIQRVPTGADTCAFCVMLASRGPVYSVSASGFDTGATVVGRGSTRTGYDASGRRLSGGVGGGIRARGKQPLGNRFHDDCDCVTVLIQTPADYPPGFSLQHYRDLYSRGAGVGRFAPAE